MKPKKEITMAEVKRRIKGLPVETRESIVCSLVGHSLVSTMCFGYVHCARCKAQVADKLCSIDGLAEKRVVVGHNCKTCRANFKKLDWKHTFLAPDPFKKEKDSAS